MVDLRLRAASGDDLDAVVELLDAADLPTADVRDGDAEFLLAYDGDDTGEEPVGVAGLEHCGRDALLRSVAVAEPHRGRGYGTALVDAMRERAAADGVRRLFLLTTTAADFFARNGFERVPRESVPAAVRATSEFAALCPDSATCMRATP